MQLPIVAPAPAVTAHADAFHDLFENRCQFQHFQHYLTGLMVLPNKSLTNIARCILESADGSSGLAVGVIKVYRIRKAQMSSPCFSTKVAVSRFWRMAL